ncbi:MAG: HU family DNA-binding protein [Thermoanaerobaculaceae bacterium]|mgnify:FL=1|nr:HU family DNA-binding protein [Thermoanaerobaculaceae bacterium]MDI9621539.1 HU family DNA-binding protein [Acidobacteriota bacterium]NLH11532.1 HU family DNA-binding protein [Holophagae bacterium]HPW55168.1 HU family DNA-binding protein [Thermoanaerobaculaceae bacterium]
MNKTELITKLAKKTELTHAKAAEAVDAIFNASAGLIADELGKGRKVMLPGFGSFSVRKRAARQGRNPATGKAIKIPARKYPAFKVGKTLREKVAK